MQHSIVWFGEEESTCTEGNNGRCQLDGIESVEKASEVEGGDGAVVMVGGIACL